MNDETMMQHPILALAESIRLNQPAAVVTVVEVKGASPAKVGAQLVLARDGAATGTVGGGKLEAAILADAREALAARQSLLKHYALKEEGESAVGTLCGGELTVFIQSYTPPPRMVIVGGGHIGRPLKIMAEAAGFETVVIDVQPGHGMVPELQQIELTPDIYVVLITTDHVADEAAMRQVIESLVPYIGMIGSRAKCQLVLDHLRTDHYAEDTLARVYAPIGLDLGGPTPGEIAVAILAEIIAVRRGGSGQIRSRG
jgi:xanthine dehydrogenase accessory factor